MEAEDKQKSNNLGGKRAGSGRPKGSGVDSKNKTLRVPTEVLDEAKRKGVKNLTSLMVEGAKDKLAEIPEPKKATRKKLL